jgi:hypothetical protein
VELGLHSAGKDTKRGHLASAAYAWIVVWNECNSSIINLYMKKLSHYLSLCPAAPTLEHWASVKRFVSLFSFLILRHLVGLLGRRIDPSQGRYLTQTQNKRIQTSMPWVGFDSMIPVFERTKTVHVLDRAATVISKIIINSTKPTDFREPYEREIHVVILATGIEEWNFSTRNFK